MTLPPNVHRVTAKGKDYYYYQVGRGTRIASARISLGIDPTHPDFWTKYRELSGAPNPEPARSIRALVEAWRKSAEWHGYEPGTHRDYNFYLGKIVEKWGPLPAADLRPLHVLAFRDTMMESPGSANHMISIGKTLFTWAIPREFASINPFREIAKLPDDDDGHWPWPDWALSYVAEHAWPDVARFVYLAEQVGQRESDVVRIGPGNREGKGLWVRPLKTKKSRKAFWVPLLSTAMIAVDGWERHPIVFDLERRKEPLAIPPGDFYVLSPAGNPYTPEGLRSRWNRWLRSEKGGVFATRWATWERSLRERDGEKVAADATLKPTLHGLRSTAVVTRLLAGYSVEQISNDVGMSIPMVRRYARFRDQRAAAESNILLLERAKKAASDS